VQASIMAGRAPAVSVLVQTYNHEPYIDQCLESLTRQTFRDFEVVIVDDASSDGTVDRVRAWLGRASVAARLVVNERNRGICASRNIGLCQCRGRFVAGLAGDDYYEPEKLEWQHAFFTTLNQTVAAVFGRARVISVEGRQLRVWFEDEVPPEGHVFERLLRGNFLPAPTIMVRRAALDEVGWYDETLFHEDYDMWLRLASRYEFRYLPRILTNYRVVPTSASRSPSNRARLYESSVRSLLKWYGRDVTTDAVVIRRARRSALAALALDLRMGRAALRALFRARPSLVHRAAIAATRLPGAHAFTSLAYAARTRWRSRRPGNRARPWRT
jgi:glycosyltransferase involved in cell wall biosynthesis